MIFSNKTILLFTCTILLVSVAGAQNADTTNRWKMNDDGSISWIIDKRLPHNDHIEMSGEKISGQLRYGVTATGGFMLDRTLIWPMLRSQPAKTRNHLHRNTDWDIIKTIHINDRPMTDEKVQEINLNGTMTVKSKLNAGLECTRSYFPSPTLPAFLETYAIKNASDKVVYVEVPEYQTTYYTDAEKGTYGKYTVIFKSTGGGSFKLDVGQSVSFNAVLYAFKEGENFSAFDHENEKKTRLALVRQWWGNLVLETPDPMLNRAFDYAKLRASESIFRTKGGLMHGPGGTAYYAAIWANDQAEYVGPFFPFLGYSTGNEASLNAYMHFARFMNPEYKPIPSSIIAEGEGTWHGAKDRGDGAMIAYGAARYALAMGDKKIAEQLWPLIEWTLEFCKRKIDKNGVVASDSDELEGRFPAGNANLCTSSLYYDALLSAVYLGKDLGKSKSQLDEYSNQAIQMKAAIEKHFGATVEGFNTYRYYDKNDLAGHKKYSAYAQKDDVLRAWICMPLTVDIYDRAEATIAALFSPQLWTPDGLATEAGQETFWDRATLYALRGVFAADEKEKALKFLQYYSNRRLLGPHVPYPVEAYPEGGQRHLSAESGLYCRIYTEGLFGIRPTGLKSFKIRPHLPTEWNSMALNKVYAFGKVFDVKVLREKGKIRITATSEGKNIFSKAVKEGELVEIKL